MELLPAEKPQGVHGKAIGDEMYALHGFVEAGGGLGGYLFADFGDAFQLRPALRVGFLRGQIAGVTAIGPGVFHNAQQAFPAAGVKGAAFLRTGGHVPVDFPENPLHALPQEQFVINGHVGILSQACEAGGFVGDGFVGGFPFGGFAFRQVAAEFAHNELAGGDFRRKAGQRGPEGFTIGGVIAGISGKTPIEAIIEFILTEAAIQGDGSQGFDALIHGKKRSFLPGGSGFFNEVMVSIGLDRENVNKKAGTKGI